MNFWPTSTHLLAIGLWLGAMVHFTFFVALKTFRTFPRLQAGDINSALFPGFYLFGILCGVVALVALYFEPGNEAKWVHITRWVLVIAMVGGSAYSTIIIRPTLNGYWEQMKAAEDPENPPADIKAAFGKLHGQSMVIGLVTMILAVIVFFTGCWVLRQ